VLVEVKGDAARLPIGQMLSAQVPVANDAPVAGVILPRSALLRRDSGVWAYVQTAPNTFVRREVHNYHPVAAGWFVASGFAEGDRVVAGGAAALLGIESPAQAADTD
jgi:multidrug efflux pump subunit AcrA (membrane-fusion protein)